jgi:hypothetical protein
MDQQYADNRCALCCFQLADIVRNGTTLDDLRHQAVDDEAFRLCAPVKHLLSPTRVLMLVLQLVLLLVLELVLVLVLVLELALVQVLLVELLQCR